MNGPRARHAIDFVRDLDTDWVRELPLADGADAFYGLLEEAPREIKTMLLPG